MKYQRSDDEYAMTQDAEIHTTGVSVALSGARTPVSVISSEKASSPFSSSSYQVRRGAPMFPSIRSWAKTGSGSVRVLMENRRGCCPCDRILRKSRLMSIFGILLKCQTCYSDRTTDSFEARNSRTYTLKKGVSSPARIPDDSGCASEGKRSSSL